jgi:hypothetical protein
MTRVVTGLFDRRRSVDTVVEHLVQEFGVPRERIQVHAADPASGDETRSPQDDDQDAALPELGLPETVAKVYGDGMRQGAVLLLAWMDDQHIDRALATYREYGATHPEAHEAGNVDETDDPEQATRVRAYHLWEQEGRPEGRELEFWLKARATEGDTAGRAPQEFAGETGGERGDRVRDLIEQGANL